MFPKQILSIQMKEQEKSFQKKFLDNVELSNSLKVVHEGWWARLLESKNLIYHQKAL